MMSKLIRILPIILNLIRFFLIKVKKSSANIVISSKCSLPFGTLEIGKNSMLVINKGVRVRKNTSIAVRDKASLRIGNNVFINRNCIITARKGVTIEENVTIGPNVSIYDHDHDIARRGGYVCKEVVIGRNVWIGGNVMILKGVTVGENSVIAAGSIVVSDVPPNIILYQKRSNSYKSIESNADK